MIEKFQTSIPFDQLVERQGIAHTPCLANLSINGWAKTEYAIASAGHPFYQLRAAELMIQEKAEVMREVAFKYRSAVRDTSVQIAEIELKREQLGQITSEDARSRFEQAQLQRDIGDLEDKLALGEVEQSKFQDMLRDLEMELEVARRQKSAILDAHPGMGTKDFIELQTQDGGDALIDKFISACAVGILQARGMPETIASRLLELSPEGRELVFRQAAIEANKVLPLFHQSAELPPEARKE